MKIFLFSLLFASILLMPNLVGAVPTGLPFGGHVLFSIPCTCVPGSVLVQYSLLYPTPYPFVFRSLLLAPASIRYSYQQFLVLPPPTAWQLGKFIPAPLTPCLGVPPLCTPPYADGIIFDVGSSFPGFIL
jgi:hypothetical protein